MTLKIHNIMYDHTQEFRTYPAGVLSIDTTTRAIHVHDGLTPNGWVLPTTANLDDYALKDLTNVTQESMNNALNTFGAMNLNKSDPLGTTQKDNFWSQVGGTAMKSETEVPEKNYLYVDSKTKTVQAGDLATLIGFGMDISKKKDRQKGPTYKEEEDGWVYVRFRCSGSDEPWYAPTQLTIDGTEVGYTYLYGYTNKKTRGAEGFSSMLAPVAAGQTYSVDGPGITKFCWYPLKYKLATAASS